jgi:GINS complex subunit 2
MSTSVSAPHTASGLCLEFISAEENEFLARETLISITSGVNHDVFEFISGNFGPLEAGLPCNVPLWFALQLRRNGKCIIEIPTWLTVESLQATQGTSYVSFASCASRAGCFVHAIYGMHLGCVMSMTCMQCVRRSPRPAGQPTPDSLAGQGRIYILTHHLCHIPPTPLHTHPFALPLRT